VIASIFIESSTAGVSLGELWDQVRDIVSDQSALRAHVDKVCLSSLGSSWQQARGLAFDEHLAMNSLAFYDAQDVPHLPQEIPEGVSEVRFRSDLSLATHIRDSGRNTSPLVELHLIDL
jgi:hypothetical protein